MKAEKTWDNSAGDEDYIGKILVRSGFRRNEIVLGGWKNGTVWLIIFELDVVKGRNPVEEFKNRDNMAVMTGVDWAAAYFE